MARKSGPNGTKPEQIGPDEFAKSIERPGEARKPATAPINNDASIDENPDGASESQLEELDDLRLATGLLIGYHDWSGKLPEKKYLKQNDEFVARKGLVRLLRNQKPLDQTLRRQLAALFDPETETAPFSSFDAAPVEGG